MTEKQAFTVSEYNGEQPSKALVILSGGMDSTITAAIAVKKYTEVHAASFFYGQKQSVELDKAKLTCEKFGIKHHLIDISFLGEMVKDVCANIEGTEVEMPNGEDVKLGDQPATYVPNRNMILFSIAASLAESLGINNLLTGIQVHDSYGYWDTTESFLIKLNSLFNENRHDIQLYAPFARSSKADEIKLLIEEYGQDEAMNILSNSITCYNPSAGASCGKCPSCKERIGAFESLCLIDPIPYQ